MLSDSRPGNLAGSVGTDGGVVHLAAAAAAVEVVVVVEEDEEEGGRDLHVRLAGDRRRRGGGRHDFALLDQYCCL